MNLPKEILGLSIKGGFPANRPQDNAEIVLDPAFWRGLSKALGWSKYQHTLTEVEHDWELLHYQNDTAKTPVYECKKCFARKVDGVITVEVEYEWVNPQENHWTSNPILKAHSRYKEGWSKTAHHFYDLILTGGDTKKFWDDLLK